MLRYAKYLRWYLTAQRILNWIGENAAAASLRITDIMKVKGAGESSRSVRRGLPELPETRQGSFAGSVMRRLEIRLPDAQPSALANAWAIEARRMQKIAEEVRHLYQPPLTREFQMVEGSRYVGPVRGCES